jgi:hypothetical protein
MAGDESAYAALGLEPGADSPTIEQAYRRLIKQHHPDREGGDARRAAEINRAYRELRAARNLRDPLDLNEEWSIPQSASRRGWLGFALLLALASASLLLLRSPLSPLAGRIAATGAPGIAKRTSAPVAARDDPMDQPLHDAVIDAAARNALRLNRTRDEMALASVSRDCHHKLRSAPSLIDLDRCAAFDDAVIELQDRDPLRDQGPFSELAVTGRMWSGATSLSDDSVAIDGRLDRIRMRVELALAATAPAVAPAALPASD